uniref:Glutathione S-transferase n=1 Tax=Phytolacca acinosa TaxID=3528 RepID=E2D553_PHYAN|nr:GST1 [Phytolacca acinosa]
MGEVKVHGVKYSPFSKRVEIALKIKGVEYEFVEEDMHNKSDQLLKYNPIHKKIPVLVHHGKPIAESLVIIEYIDEMWKANPILPTDPYERAQARFWTKFFDDKLLPALWNALMVQREDEGKAMEEAHESLKSLENKMSGKEFSERIGFGFLDIQGGIMVAFWIPIIQQISGKEGLTRDKYPAIWAWADHLLGCNLIKENLPDGDPIRTALKARLQSLQANPPK